MMPSLLHVAMALFLLAGGQAYAGLREELQEVAAAYMEAVNARDLDRAVLVYTEDCAMMAPGMDVAHGHDGVRRIWKDIHDMGVTKLYCVMEEVGPDDAADRAYDRTSCTVFDEKGNIVSKGKHIVVWKKVDGKWLAHIDMWNTDFAVAPQMDDDTLKAELEVLSEAFTAAWMAQDFAAMASFYTDDACLMPPDHGIIRGKQAVQKALEAFYSEELAEAHLWPEEVGYLGMSKDMIYYRGYARWLTKDAERANEIKIVLLGKKVDGQWKIYKDIWSSNNPPDNPHDEL